MDARLAEFSDHYPVAWSIGLLAAVCVVGMAIGSIRMKGVGLGAAGVLFAGLGAGHLLGEVPHETLEFVKELGLALFVYTMGLQLGPGIFAFLRKDGWKLNLLALFIVLSGAGVAVGLSMAGGFAPVSVPGLFAGATTNTPSLGAVQQTVAQMEGVDPLDRALPALAYAVAYPFAIAGIIGVLILLRTVYRFDPAVERQRLRAEERARPKLVRRTFRITNEGVDGKRIGELEEVHRAGVVFSRISSPLGTHVRPATAQTRLELGDRVVAVGTEEALDRIGPSLGRFSVEDLVHTEEPVIYRRAIVTRPEVLGKTVQEIGLEERFGVVVSRVTRSDIEVTAVPGLRLQFGDMLRLVGEEKAIEEAGKAIGDSLQKLNSTNFLTFFLGLFLGVALGMVPLAVPGMPQPLRLGLAGGPLLVAILMSRFARIGPLICYMPTNANLAFREFGIALFFAAVGLMAGTVFLDAVFSSQGGFWILGGLLITLVPLLLAGFFAMSVMKLGFPSVAGLVAGSMTDPPALAFATTVCQSEQPNVSYAAVYPLTTLLRIMSAQILVLWLCR